MAVVSSTGTPGVRNPPPTTTGPALTGGGGGAAGGGTPGGGPPDANPELLTRGTGPNPEFIMRDFTAGMHCNPTRDAIAEQDLWWLENLQPLASGNVVPVSAPLVITPDLAGETQLPTYTTNVMVGSEGYIFSYFNNTGNGWIVNSSSGAATKIIAGLLPITQTTGDVAAIPYMDGFLIIAGNGHYWDYNLTSANTLTELSGGISVWNNFFKTSVRGGTPLAQVMNAHGNITGQFQTHYQVISVQLHINGAGYVVGDSLTLTDGSPFRPAQIIVTATGTGGDITGLNLADAGDYPGPKSPTPIATGPVGGTVSGGTGTGAVFITMIQATSVTIIKPGNGYINNDELNDSDLAANRVIDTWFGTVGVTSGTAIATFAGRVWIGDHFNIYVTDVDSYNYFGGAGTTFTISDSYFSGCTVLFAANNYLYVFSGQSVDVVSNVTVNATSGLTSFARVNVLQGIGCPAPAAMTVSAFARGVAFMDFTGYYLLAGATPERISDRWQAVIRTVDFTRVTSAGTFPLNNELCLGVTMQFTDSFSTDGTPVIRNCTFVFQRRRWWVQATPYEAACGPMASVPTGIAYPGLYLWFNQGGAIGLARLFGAQAQGHRIPGQNMLPWLIRTKLWDGAATFREKQSINLALAAIWSDPQAAPGVTFTVDSEIYDSPQVDLPSIENAGGYNYALQVYRGAGAAQAWGSQFIGLSFYGNGANVNVVSGLALRGKQERNMLE